MCLVGIYSLVVSILLLLFIPVFELVRKKESVIDFLTPINIMFWFLFSIVPMYLYFFNEYISWNVLKRTDMGHTVFFLGELIALLFYCIVIICYYFANKFQLIQKLKFNSEKMYGKVQDNHFFKVALILYIIGGTSLLLYVRALGGYNEFMRLGELIRNDGSASSTPLAFLKHFTSLLYLSTFLFYSFIKKTKGTKKFLTLCLFLTSAIGGTIVAIQNSGRLTLLIFIITLPIAYMVKKNKIQLKTVLIGGLLFSVITIFGNELLSKNDQVVFERPQTAFETTTKVIEEFSFPYNNIANIMTVYPYVYEFRGGFSDVANAFLEYIPSSLINLGFDKQTASQMNTTLYNTYGQIPVDIVTFGYMSFGVAGVMIVAVIFGMLLRFLESLFYYKGDFISCILYVCLMFQTTFAVMYGDPHQIIMGFFRYIIALFLIFVFVKRSKSSKFKLKRVVW